MRLRTPYDPTVKSVEEPAHLGLAAIPAPPTNDRVDLFDKRTRVGQCFTLGTPTNPVLEVLDGFRTGKSVKAPPAPPLRISSAAANRNGRWTRLIL